MTDYILFIGPNWARIDDLMNFSLNYDFSVDIFTKSEFSDFLHVLMILLVDLQSQ